MTTLRRIFLEALRGPETAWCVAEIERIRLELDALPGQRPHTGAPLTSATDRV
jgi:hypothetical protein